MSTENEEWIEASRTYAAENERRFVRINDAANPSAEKIIDLEITIAGLNLELIEAKDRVEKLIESNSESGMTRAWFKKSCEYQDEIKRLRGVLEDVLEESELNKSAILGKTGIYKMVQVALEAKP